MCAPVPGMYLCEVTLRDAVPTQELRFYEMARRLTIYSNGRVSRNFPHPAPLIFFQLFFLLHCSKNNHGVGNVLTMFFTYGHGR